MFLDHGRPPYAILARARSRSDTAAPHSDSMILRRRQFLMLVAPRNPPRLGGFLPVGIRVPTMRPDRQAHLLFSREPPRVPGAAHRASSKPSAGRWPPQISAH